MDLNPIVLSIPIYFLLIGIELIAERFSKRKEYRLHDALTNMSCGITQQLSGIFLKVIGLIAFQFVYENFRLFNFEATWYTNILLFIGADFCYYWAHRMSHEVNLFWGGHVVHHQSEDYNFTVALRQSSLQTLWTFFFYLPLALIGFDAINFALMSGLVTVYQFWIHTEYIGKMGWFEKIFNTPSHHRVHHGRDPKYIDRNHAGVFIIWDKMFGTFQQEEEKPTYGITTPLNSWNPLYANFSHYHHLFGQLKQTPKWSDRLKMLFKKPGWMPEKGVMPVLPVDKTTYQKFNTSAPDSLNYYALFQYLIILAGTAFFLFKNQLFSLGEKTLICSLLTLGVVNLGALFERKNWSFFTEILRIFTLPLALNYFTASSGSNLLITGLAVGISLISLFWILKLRGHLLRQPESELVES